MVYRGGCGSRLDDECASPSVTMIGSRSAWPRASGKGRSDGAFCRALCVGEGNVGMRCRRYRQGNLGAEGPDRAGRYHHTAELARRELRPDRDRGWAAVAVAGQCVDCGRAAGDLRRDAAHEGIADGAANQQDGPQRRARDRADDAGRPVQAGACEDLVAQEQRMLLTSRKLLQGKLLDLESDLRGTLRNFGLKVGVVSGGRYGVRVRELMAGFPGLAAIAEPLLKVRQVMRQQL